MTGTVPTQFRPRDRARSSSSSWPRRRPANRDSEPMRLNIEKDEHGKRSLVLRRGDQLMRDEVTSLGETVFENQIASLNATLQQTTFSPRMVDYVWVADRCIQLNAQQIATMPVKFNSPFPNS